MFNTASTLADALHDSLERLSRGQTLEDCVRAHPQYEPELRGLLLAGLSLRQLDFTDAAAQLAYQRGRERVAEAMARPRPVWRRPQRRWLVAAVLLFIVGVLVIGLWPDDQQQQRLDTTATIMPLPTITDAPSNTPLPSQTPTTTATATFTPILTVTATPSSTPPITSSPTPSNTATATRNAALPDLVLTTPTRTPVTFVATTIATSGVIVPTPTSGATDGDDDDDDDEDDDLDD